jgi:hypothetical protein
MLNVRSFVYLKYVLVLVLVFISALPAVPPPFFPPDNSTNITPSNSALFIQDPPSPTGQALYSVPTDNFGEDQIDPYLVIVNSQTGQDISQLDLFLLASPEDRICKLRGLATHPTTGMLYSVMDLGVFDDDEQQVFCDDFVTYLVEIDPADGLTDIIGYTGEAFSALAFDDTGTLYGVLSSSSTSGALYSIDIASASTIYVDDLSGFNGHALAFNPNDGLLYHATRNGGSIVLETYNTNTSVLTPIAVPGPTPLDLGNPRAMTWDEATGQFLFTNTVGTLYRVGTDGSESSVGFMQHESKGLAFTAANTNNFNLYYTCTPAPGGGFDYAFELRPEQPAALSALIGQIMFFESAQGAILPQNHTLPGGPPPSFNVSFLGTMSGNHTGVGITSDFNYRWQPVALNHFLTWTSHADNLVDPILWSTWDNPNLPATIAFQEAIKIQKYDFYFGTTNPPTQLICADTQQTFCVLPQGRLTMLPCTTYYWQLKNATETGPVWTFTTRSNQYDSSGDGTTNWLDFDAFDAKFGQTGCNSGNNWCNFDDKNFDGEVSLFEVTLFAHEFLHVCP